MFRRILVPLDGSLIAENVLPYAAKIASVFDAALHLLYVIPGAGQVGPERRVDPLAYRLTEAERTDYLDKKAAELRALGLKVRTLIQEGGAAEVIVDLLAGGYELVALTTHGEGCGRQLWVGSTAIAVTLNARSSILLAPASPGQSGHEIGPSLDPGLHRVLTPVDCSPRSDWAVGVAAAIARASDSELELLHVVEKPELMNRLADSGEVHVLVEKLLELNRQHARRYLQETAWRLRGTDVAVKEKLIETEDGVADALRSFVKAERPDLVVLSAHGRGASCEWPLGGTAAKLVFWTERPVLILQDLPVERVKPRWTSPPRQALLS